jgi:hypothetical protein
LIKLELRRRGGGGGAWVNLVVIIAEGETSEEAIRRTFGPDGPPPGMTIILLRDNGRG